MEDVSYEETDKLFNPSSRGFNPGAWKLFYRRNGIGRCDFHQGSCCGIMQKPLMTSWALVTQSKLNEDANRGVLI